MRTVGLLLSLVVAASGCKSSGGGSEAPAPDPAALKAQQELVAKREKLLAEREKDQNEATQLQIEIQDKQAKGENTAELEKKLAELQTKIESSRQQVESVATEIDKKTQDLAAQGGGAAQAAREANLLERERRVAQREKELTQTAERLAQLERTAADRWKESCTVGGTQTIIQQVAPPKDGKYNRRDVDVMLGRAKTLMSRKGLVNADLGAQASLENEVTKAMNDQDWARAYVLANQLVATVDAIKIDRPFIKAKYDRLQARVRAAKVDEGTSKQLEAGVQEISSMFGSGDFVAVNRKINQIAALLR